MMTPRPYQEAAVNSIFNYYTTGGKAPLISLPTGSGKSVVIAEFLRRAIEMAPDETIMVVSHVKELLSQNADHILRAWPEAPLGMYSAGLGRREVRQITVAGVQSIYRHAHKLGNVGVLVVDEVHLVPRDGSGMYLTLLKGLRQTNPHLALLGLSATPYRLDSGPLHEGEDAIFDGIAYEADILSLVQDGYLVPLKSRIGVPRADLKHVHIRGGDFIPGELEAAMDRQELVAASAEETVRLCADRHKWLVFCCGVEHAAHVAATLRSLGIATECVTGDMNATARSGALAAFREGKLRALTNCNVLTTGFDQPDIDALIMLRPTLSTGLYVQMCGRGMRTAPGKANCLLLDYAGNILRHGPLCNVRPHTRGHGESQERLSGWKECPRCHGVVEEDATVCPECCYEFKRERHAYVHDTRADRAHDVMGQDNLVTADVEFVEYNRHERLGKIPSMRVTYYCRSDGRCYAFSEWICVEHPGYPSEKAQRWLRERGATQYVRDVNAAMGIAEDLRYPKQIIVDTSGRFPRIVTHRGWVEREEGVA